MGIYLRGSTGVNCEETTILCDTNRIFIKFWADLDIGKDSWPDPTMYIGNSDLPYQGKENLMYHAQANLNGGAMS